MSKYSMRHFELWAEEYKKCYSFSEVGRKFGVSHAAVKRNLIKHRDKFDIKTKQDLHNEGLRRCSACKEIKPIPSFGTHWQKSRCTKCGKQMSRDYRKNNIEKSLESGKKWYNNNKQAKAAYKKKYAAKQKNNIKFLLQKRLRGRLWEAIRNRKKVGSAVVDLGCTVEELKNYLEKKFYISSINEMMSWDNYGYNGWHIDHIIPLASFDLENRKQFLEACHYTNLQPLWSDDHKAKAIKDSVMIKQSHTNRRNK